MKLFKSLRNGRQTLLTSAVHVCAVARCSSCCGCAAGGDIRRLTAASRPPPPVGAFLCCVCHKELHSNSAGTLQVRAHARFPCLLRAHETVRAPGGSVRPPRRRCSEQRLYNRDIIYLIQSRARLLQQESSQAPARPPGTPPPHPPSSEGTAAFVQTGFDVTCCQGNQALRRAGTLPSEEGRNWKRPF